MYLCDATTIFLSVLQKWSLYGLLSCDSSPMCKKCCVFARRYTLDDDLER